MRRWIELFFLVAGLAGVGIWVWSEARLYVYQKEAKRILQHSAVLRPPPGPRLGLQDGALIGKLVIPRLKLEAVVREGAGESTLDTALGHIPGTALPGKTGNVGIAGHRDTLFRGLRHIRREDLIQLDTPGGKFQYQVEDTRIVKPDNVEVLSAGASPELTLVTCYPFYYVGSAPDRFIVKARAVTAQPPQAPVDHAVVAEESPAAPKPRAMLVRARAVTPQKRPIPPAVPNVTKFQVSERGTSQVAPGILMGVSWIDARRRRASGWIWLASERRTIWLRDLAVNEPLVFQQASNRRQHEVFITTVTDNSVAGYLVQGQ